jgi:hypothetical protein
MVSPKVKGKVHPASTRTFAYRIYTMSRHETAYNDISQGNGIRGITAFGRMLVIG